MNFCERKVCPAQLSLSEIQSSGCSRRRFVLCDPGLACRVLLLAVLAPYTSGPAYQSRSPLTTAMEVFESNKTIIWHSTLCEQLRLLLALSLAFIFLTSVNNSYARQFVDIGIANILEKKCFNLMRKDFCTERNIKSWSNNSKVEHIEVRVVYMRDRVCLHI